jgi:hypothetical protein
MVTRALLVVAAVLVACPLRAEDAGEAKAPSTPAEPAPHAVSVPAPAATPVESAAPKGELAHAPVSFARIGEPILIRAAIDHPELVRRALLVCRTSEGGVAELAFERTQNGPYAAVIPKEQVRPPSVAYAIEIEDESGARRLAFATRGSMHTVQVAEENVDVRETALLSRIGGRRSVLSLEGDYVSFGESVASTATSATPETVADRYYRVEGNFSYRLLRTVSAFGVRVGAVRGQSPVPNAQDVSAFDVGLNYGAPRVQFRLHDLFHLDVEGLLSLTEEGFSTGGGSALHIGDVYGSELVVGFETVNVFGTRAYTRVNVAAARRLILSGVVEGTDMPHASRFGLRLFGEVGVDLGAGFRLIGRGGYQARDSASGGPNVGLVGSVAF